MFRWLYVVMLVFAVGSVFGQDSAVEEPTQEPRTVRELLQQSFDWYGIYPNSKAKEPVKPEEILRWVNPVRNSVTDGISAVYMEAHRPIAVVGIFPSGGRQVTHEFHFLGREQGLIGRNGDKSFWAPKEVLEFRNIPDAMAPKDSERLRLLQMKRLAKRFEVEMLGWNQTNSDKQMLRRLTTEVFRYGRQGTNTLDGTIFAFCIYGTDPEAFLQIEAYRENKDKQYTWQYAFSRSSGAKMEGRIDKKKIVWTTKKFAPMHIPTLAWRGIHRAVDYRNLPTK